MKDFKHVIKYFEKLMNEYFWETIFLIIFTAITIITILQPIPYYIKVAIIGLSVVIVGGIILPILDIIFTIISIIVKNLKKRINRL
ncbi:MAG: hypothetical protein ACXAAH_00250 [Promethearchaeota archaeon]|jgi:hypothetical protein